MDLKKQLLEAIGDREYDTFSTCDDFRWDRNKHEAALQLKGEWPEGFTLTYKILHGVYDWTLRRTKRQVSLKEQLQEILKQIDDNKINAWDGPLQDTIPAVALSDFDDNDPESGDEKRPVIKYNGWYERLKQLTQIL